MAAHLILTTVQWSMWPKPNITSAFHSQWISESRDYSLHCLPRRGVKSLPVVTLEMSFLFNGAPCSCWPAGQWFSCTESSTLCWGSTDSKKVGHYFLDAPFCTSLRLINIILPRKPPSLYTIWLKHHRSSEGWQKAGKKGGCFTSAYQGSSFVYLCGFITPRLLRRRNNTSPNNGTLEGCALFSASSILPTSFWNVQLMRAEFVYT